MRKALLLVFVVALASPFVFNKMKVQGIDFVEISGRVLGADGRPIGSAKIGSRDMETNFTSYTCTNSDGRWSLELPVDLVARDLSLQLSNRMTGNPGIDCETSTTGAIPSLGCYAEFGPFVATSNRTINLEISELDTYVLRIVDGDGYPVYGANINSRNGQQGPCPISSPQLATIRAEDNGSDVDSDMDGLITVVGAFPSGKDLQVVGPSGVPLNINLNSFDQQVVLPIRQTLPRAPRVRMYHSKDRLHISVSANASDLGLSKFTAKLFDGSSLCTISLQSNIEQGECEIVDWIRGHTYSFVTTAWNGRGEGTATATQFTTRGWNTTSTSSSIPATFSASKPASVNIFYMKRSETVTARSLARFFKIAVPSKSKISLKVSSKSARVCKVSGTRLRGSRVGSCKVKVTVKPPKGKSISRTVTLKVSK